MAVLHIEYTMNKIPERSRTSQDEPGRARTRSGSCTHMKISKFITEESCSEHMKLLKIDAHCKVNN